MQGIMCYVQCVMCSVLRAPCDTYRLIYLSMCSVCYRQCVIMCSVLCIMQCIMNALHIAQCIM
jgi:hypothetical protein